MPDTHRDRPDIALPTARFLKSQNSLLGWAHFVGLEGAPPPKRVVINEFDSLEQAEAYYKFKSLLEAVELVDDHALRRRF